MLPGIRPATAHDVPGIKAIADKNKTFIGFVLRPALVEASLKGWLLVSTNPTGEITGFVNTWHRKDKTITVLEICVSEAYRGQGIGTALINSLPRPLKLKCTIENPANEFYRKLGFKLAGQVEGKTRQLNLWQLI